MADDALTTLLATERGRMAWAAMPWGGMGTLGPDVLPTLVRALSVAPRATVLAFADSARRKGPRPLGAALPSMVLADVAGGRVTPGVGLFQAQRPMSMRSAFNVAFAYAREMGFPTMPVPQLRGALASAVTPGPSGWDGQNTAELVGAMLGALAESGTNVQPYAVARIIAGDMVARRRLPPDLLSDPMARLVARSIPDQVDVDAASLRVLVDAASTQSPLVLAAAATLAAQATHEAAGLADARLRIGPDEVESALQTATLVHVHSPFHEPGFGTYDAHPLDVRGAGRHLNQVAALVLPSWDAGPQDTAMSLKRFLQRAAPAFGSDATASGDSISARALADLCRVSLDAHLHAPALGPTTPARFMQMLEAGLISAPHMAL